MSNRAAIAAVATAFAVGLIASLAVRPASRVVRTGDGVASASVRWRLPSAFGTHLPALGDNVLRVAQSLTEASAGRVRIEVFEPGEVVPAFSIVDAVRDAKVQAGYTWLGYDQGKLAASVLFGAVPFGMEPWEFAAWWYEGGGREP
jgi:TRAP-type mannitol/chloroaromatic compound transport system substrate-binding protein